MTPAGFLLDLDGTVYQDGALIPGADAAIGALRDAGVPVRFVTNTTRVQRATIAGWLADFGVPAEEDDIFTPPSAAVSWLRDRGTRRVAVCLPDDGLAEFERFDLVPVDPSPGSARAGGEEAGGDREAVDAVSPEVVVIGDLGAGWSFDVMNRVFRWVLDGAGFVALHRNRYWKTGGALVLDAGAIVAAFEYATGREATLVGKPSRPMFEAAARSMGLGLEEVAMVGDDLQADIGGSRALGCRTILVRTGKYRAEELEGSAIEPDAVIDSLAALPGLLG
jgi:HAD superfamily hydrolase (TIGR01450 family)